MANKIVIEEVYKTNNEDVKKKIIRRNLINMIKNIQEKETCLKA